MMTNRKPLWIDDEEQPNDCSGNPNQSRKSAVTFPESELIIDSFYAQHYERRKQREEYSKLKDIYGDHTASSGSSEDDENKSNHRSHRKIYSMTTTKTSSSSTIHALSHSHSSSEDNEDEEDDEEEDETGELITPELDAQILRTISLIRSKDPLVYDTSKHFFEDQDMEEIRRLWKQRQQALRREPKKITLKDYERDQIVSQMKVAFPNDDESSSSSKGWLRIRNSADDDNRLAEDSSNDHDGNHDIPMMTGQSVVPALGSNSSERLKLMTPTQEQEQARQELIEAFHRFDDDVQENDGRVIGQDNDVNAEDNMIQGGLFRQRIKSREELEQEEEAYRKFLLAEEEKEREKRVEELATLRRFWTDPNLDENERFLRE
jgi:hypothetical protein